VISKGKDLRAVEKLIVILIDHELGAFSFSHAPKVGCDLFGDFLGGGWVTRHGVQAALIYVPNHKGPLLGCNRVLSLQY